MNSPGLTAPTGCPGGDSSSCWPAGAVAAATAASCAQGGSPAPSVAFAGSSCGSSPVNSGRTPTAARGSWTNSIWKKARSFPSLDGAALLSPLTAAADAGSEYSYPMSNFAAAEPLPEPAAAAAGAPLPPGSIASEPPTPQAHSNILHWQTQTQYQPTQQQQAHLQHSSSFPQLPLLGLAPAVATGATAAGSPQFYAGTQQCSGPNTLLQGNLPQQQLAQGQWLQQAAPMLLAQQQQQQAAAAAAYFQPQQMQNMAHFQQAQQQLAAAAAFQQQLHLQAQLQQQVQLVPVMQLMPAAVAAPAAAGLGLVPGVNSSSRVQASAQGGGYPHSQQHPVPMRSAWQMIWEEAVSKTAARNNHQQEQGEQTAPGLAFVLRPVAAAASAAAAALMCALVAVVACLLGAKLRLQGAYCTVRAAVAAVTGFASSSADAFRDAAAEAVGADNVEELKALLQQQQHKGQIQLLGAGGGRDDSAAAAGGISSSGSSGLRRRTRASQAYSREQAAAAAAAAAALAPPDSAASAAGRGSLYERCLVSVQDLMVALGLWSGVLVWVSRWLVLQAPAATRQAVSHSCRQGRSAAEGAAAAVFEHVFCLLYGLAWTLARQLHLVCSVLGQRLYVHCTAAAQRLCCFGLLLVDLFCGDARRQRSAVQVVAVNAVQAVGAAASRVGQVWFGVGETLAAAVTAQLLKEASPVTQTAVWGLAGMLRRNLMESFELGWQLLLQLSQVYVATQQQHAAQQQQGRRGQQQQAKGQQAKGQQQQPAANAAASQQAQ